MKFDGRIIGFVTFWMIGIHLDQQRKAMGTRLPPRLFAVDVLLL